MKMINYKKLRIDGFFLVSGQLFQAVLAFRVNLVLVRHVSPSEFGRFALILAGTSLVFSVILPRINILIIRMPEKDYTEKVKDMLFSAMTLETLAATLMISLRRCSSAGCFTYIHFYHGIIRMFY